MQQVEYVVVLFVDMQMSVLDYMRVVLAIYW